SFSEFLRNCEFCLLRHASAPGRTAGGTERGNQERNGNQFSLAFRFRRVKYMAAPPPPRAATAAATRPPRAAPVTGRVSSAAGAGLASSAGLSSAAGFSPPSSGLGCSLPPPGCSGSAGLFGAAVSSSGQTDSAQPRTETEIPLASTSASNGKAASFSL